MHNLRPSTAADLHRVATWIGSADEARLWAGRRISYPVAVSALERDLEFEFADSWSLFDGDSLRAFGQVVPKPGRRQHLARLIVDPQSRRSGLGRGLAEHLVRAAQAFSPIRISLNVAPSNFAALTLYQGLGFVVSIRPEDEPPSESLYLEQAL